MASKSQELLLLSATSSDPFTTLIVNPLTGGSYWSYKGAELQNGVSGLVEPLGRRGDFLLIAIHEKPLLHVVSVHGKNKFHVKTVLSGPIRCLASHPEGTYIFAAIGLQIFTWMAFSGELLSVVDAHYQNISTMKISCDGSFLVTGSEDGHVHVYSIIDLVCEPEHKTVKVEPSFKWNAHSLAVTDLHITAGNNPRVISVSLDHTAVFYSFTQKQLFHRISSDRPLHACAMDPSETRLFLGTDQGQVAMVNLYTQCQPREQMITTNGGSLSELKVLENHKAPISRLAVNAEGSLLVSSDIEGNYAIIDIRSLQCLKLNSIRSKVHTLRFIENWPSLSEANYKAPKFVPSVLQKQKGTSLLVSIPLLASERTEKDDSSNAVETVVDQLISRIRNNDDKQQPTVSIKVSV
uniref:Uncharacterized protein n=1 Tax=Acrobeloides nanus TaxID=290746 RepID=A0A914D0T6_9BILA